MATDDFDMGVVAEGQLQYDLPSRSYVIQGEQNGKSHRWVVDDALKKYEGQDVRVVIVTFDTINKVAKLVEEGGLRLEDAVVGKPR